MSCYTRCRRLSVVPGWWSLSGSLALGCLALVGVLLSSGCDGGSGTADRPQAGPTASGTAAPQARSGSRHEEQMLRGIAPEAVIRIDVALIDGDDSDSLVRVVAIVEKQHRFAYDRTDDFEQMVRLLVQRYPDLPLLLTVDDAVPFDAVSRLLERIWSVPRVRLQVSDRSGMARVPLDRPGRVYMARTFGDEVGAAPPLMPIAITVSTLAGTGRIECMGRTISSYSALREQLRGLQGGPHNPAGLFTPQNPVVIQAGSPVLWTQVLRAIAAAHEADYRHITLTLSTQR